MADLPGSPPKGAPPWYCRRSFVLLNLFFLLGPLAYPLLWKSREFSASEKWGFTLAVLALTALMVGGLAFIGLLLYRHLQEINSVMNQAF